MAVRYRQMFHSIKEAVWNDSLQSTVYSLQLPLHIKFAPYISSMINIVIGLKEQDIFSS
jgi:hypothetical protein